MWMCYAGCMAFGNPTLAVWVLLIFVVKWPLRAPGSMTVSTFWILFHQGFVHSVPPARVSPTIQTKNANSTTQGLVVLLSAGLVNSNPEFPLIPSHPTSSKALMRFAGMPFCGAVGMLIVIGRC